MYKQMKFYVEEIWVEHFVDSYIREIKSIEDYLENTEFDSTLIGFRFFQRELIVLNEKKYISEPENYTEWICNNCSYFKNVTINDEEIKFENCITLEKFILEKEVELNLKKQKKHIPSMNDCLNRARVRISEILRDEYGLSLEEAVECINTYGVIELCNENSDYLELFLQTDCRTWAQRMYEHYNDNVRRLKRNNK